MDDRSVEEILEDHLGRSHNVVMFENISDQDKKRAFGSVTSFLNSKVAVEQRQERIESNQGLCNYYLAAAVLAERISNEGFNHENFNILFDQLCGGIFEDPHHGIFRLVYNSNFQWESFDWTEWEEMMLNMG